MSSRLRSPYVKKSFSSRCRQRRIEPLLEDGEWLRTIDDIGLGLAARGVGDDKERGAAHLRRRGILEILINLILVLAGAAGKAGVKGIHIQADALGDGLQTPNWK